MFLLYCSPDHLDTGERILHSGVQGLGWCLWTCDNMVYTFHSDTLSCSFWGVMDHSRQSPHFELGMLVEEQAAGKIGEDAISLQDLPLEFI